MAVEPTPVRDADAACGRCHAEIMRNYLATPMANASGVATENVQPGAFLHKTSGTEYRVTKVDAHIELTYRSKTLPGGGGEVPLSYFLGSGHLGTTYLYSVDAYLFESPIAWYEPSHGYDMKPGLTELAQAPPPLPMQSGCLRCHMSSVQPSDAGTINRYSGLPFAHTGITCEACHGDSSPHVKSNGKAKLINPARLSADLRDSICISCHLEGDVLVERAGHTALHFKPGESISTYLAFYVRRGANLTARGVSEVEQLGQSMCKRVSGDRMSCMSCHDPHYTPRADQKVGFYRAKCLACHTEPQFASSHHPENQDCTSCHMPRNGAVNIQHVAWTDHRIQRVPNDAQGRPEAAEGGELTPIFSPAATKRDLAMANYQALLDGDRSRESTAWAQLDAQRDNIHDDKEALKALGNLSAERGDNERAEHVFRRVLELDADDLTALSNLGTLLAKQGRLDEAVSLLKKAFDRNRDLSGLAKNLARVQCTMGDTAGAHATLSAALYYSPGDESMRRLLAQMNDCAGRGAR